jgi:hypothetical protein
MLAKPAVSELASCSTRQIREDCCLVFEASKDWPHYKMNYFILQVTDKTAFLGSANVFIFFAFFGVILTHHCVFLPSRAFFCLFDRFLGVRRVVARLRPALICCTPAARQLVSETC